MRNRSFAVMLVLMFVLVFSASAGAMHNPAKLHTVKPRSAAAHKQHKVVKSPKVKEQPVKSYSVPYVGFSDNLVLTTDDQLSKKVVAMAKDLGATMIRVNVYFQLKRDGGLYMQAATDPAALCNAAVNAASVGITLMMTYMPTYNRGYPQTPAELAEVIGNLDTGEEGDVGMYHKALLDPVTGCANGRDGKPLVKLIEQIGNEMNIDTFCQPQNDDDHNACAQIAAVMQAWFYHYIKGVEEPRYGVQLLVLTASVASHHTPWLYWAQYKHKMDVLTHCICADAIAWHGFPLWGSSDQSSGFNTPLILLNCKFVFGSDCGTAKLPIFNGEWAVQTVIPASKAALYTNQEPQVPLIVPEAQQGPLTQNYVNYCRLQHSLGCVILHVVDEPVLNTGFQSGVYYPDFTPKSSLAAVRTAILSASAPTRVIKAPRKSR